VEKGTRESTFTTGEVEIYGVHRANQSFSIVISDPNDPKFDLEAYLTMKMADEAK